MMVTIGTFNLNNLFSRFNFTAAISPDETNVIETTMTLNLDTEEDFRFREFRGRLVTGKREIDRQRIAERIRRIDLDVLAVQEVEDIDTLKRFNRQDLNGLYPNVVLIEGNDRRLIDVGLMSKLPIGGVRSWQTAVHPDESNRRIFSRDLLEVDIFNQTRSRRLFSIYNNHLKSKFNQFNDPAVDRQNDERRHRQAEIIADIVQRVTRPNSRYMILGDMNDSPDAPALEPIVNIDNQEMVDGLANPIETREFDAGIGDPVDSRWTHRFRKGGETHFELLDQIWLSPSLGNRQTGSFIDRRKRAGGDGSDHDPAWVELDI